MSKRLISLFSLVIVIGLAFLALPFNGATQAQGKREGLPDRSALQAERLNGSGAEVVIDERLKDVTGLVKVIIELTDVPAAAVYGGRLPTGSERDAVDAARDQVNRIELAQQQLTARLGALNAQVLNSTQRVFNGVSVIVDASQLAAIAKLPGVKKLHKVNIVERDHTSSVPLVGAPTAWTNTGNTGTGTIIAIMDTGIDYIHTNFGGLGTTFAYTNNNTLVDEPGTADGYPNAKVVSGFDFVGDAYNGSNTPAPDPDPIDCASALGGGHGSHVAGTSGGYGVNADGTTFAGPYNSSINFNALRIGPGVAPQAQLMALRVFGCTGSTSDDIMVDAIEFALDPNNDGDFTDRADVLNASIGGPFNSPDGPTQVASDNASLAGIVMVGSGGNTSDVYYVTGGSVGNARRAIAAASSVDSLDVTDGFRVNAPAAIANVYPAFRSSLYPRATPPVTLTLPVTSTIYYPAPTPVTGQPTSFYQSGCAPFTTADKAEINGKILLVDWVPAGFTAFPCGSGARANNAQAAGAVGVIMVDNTPYFSTAIAGNATIPAFFTNSTSGTAIKAQLTPGDVSTVSATLTFEYNNSVKFVHPETNDTLSGFSSRGPRRGDSLLKPEISAPGQSIFSTDSGTGTQGDSLNGTSMASPHVAGAMALFRQQHPDWSVEELKALVMNTANTEVRQTTNPASTLYGPGRVGVGRMMVEQAVNSQVIAYDANGAGGVSVSFGQIEVVGTATASRTVRVVNKGTTAETYSVAYVSRVDVPSVSFSVSPSSITVAGGSTVDVVVTMTADAANMQHTRDTTVAATQLAGALGNLPRHWLSEEAGILTLTPATSGAVSLRLPVHAAARPASNMQAGVNPLVVGTGGTASVNVPLTGQEVFTRGSGSVPTYPLDEVSIVTAFEMQHASPISPSLTSTVRAADLKSVGVASDIRAAGTITDTLITFGVASHGTWSTSQPYDTEFDIYIDINEDGSDDFVLFNWNATDAVTAGTADQSDVFISILDDIRPSGPSTFQYFINGFSASQFNTVLYNTSVMALGVDAASLGLTPANTSFNYRVVTFSGEASGVVDRSPTLRYDAANPGLDVSGGTPGFPVYFDLNGDSIPVNFDRAAYTANASQGLLLLHHHNAAGDHDEVVAIVDQAPTATATSTALATEIPTEGPTTNPTDPPVGTQTAQPTILVTSSPTTAGTAQATTTATTAGTAQATTTATTAGTAQATTTATTTGTAGTSQPKVYLPFVAR